MREPLPMSGEATALFDALRRSAGERSVAAIEDLLRDEDDSALNRVNPLAFARRFDLDEEQAIAAFLHAAQLGLFEMSWNVLCPGCGGVLDASATLKSVDRDQYHCTLCAAGYEPTLDEMVEVTFTVSPRIRRIAAHDPDLLPLPEYFRQIFWGSGMDVTAAQVEAAMQDVLIDALELEAGEKAVLSTQLPPGFVIVFDPVTHTVQFLEVGGEPTRERQHLSIMFNDMNASVAKLDVRPGPLRLALENRLGRRVLPGLWLADDVMHALMSKRRPFLTAKRLLTNQVFRDMHRTDTLDVNQRLKITSLTFLFTDLKASTELYDRVGDLAAFDLVRAHFRLLHEIVAAEAGAVVKTIGDAVMATFPSPDRAVAAALRMREAMDRLNGERGGEDLVLKIGIHEGPCLAVMLDERQDYFGQTVNIASRVQGLANSRAIFVTRAVFSNAEASEMLRANGFSPQAHQSRLRGIGEEFTLYAIP
jgi:class 3 adenylate cyclase